MGTTCKFRGSKISDAFISEFKKSKFYTEIYRKHSDEILIGIRKDYINMYYNCDSIAKIVFRKKQLQAEINGYFIDKKGDGIKITEQELIDKYDDIKKNSDNRNKEEKQAQEQLVLRNNENKNSNWFCIDVEYKKSFEDINSVDFFGRFDIIAISKKAPHQVALIELKYGDKAISGESGIRKHIKDFHRFNGEDSKKESYFMQLRPELVEIIKKLDAIGVEIPSSLKNIQVCDISLKPSFYFITLNNNPATSDDSSTPKMKMGGQLFADKRKWKCKKVSSLVATDGDYNTLIKNDKNFNPIFLFSKAKLPNLGIDNLLDEKYYEKEEITLE